MSTPVGTLCVVLHTHLPWLPRHGTWPVGEEWLHQAWAGCYLPMVETLRSLADEGRTDLVTLGRDTGAGGGPRRPVRPA